LKKVWIDTKQIPAVERETLGRILGYVRPYWPQAIVLGLCITSAAALNLLPPFFIKEIVDHAIPERQVTLLWALCFGMVAGPAIAGLFQVGQKYVAEKMGQQVMLDLRVQLYRHLHRMSISFFSRQKPGETVSYILNDVQGVGGVVTNTLVDVVQNTVVLVSTVVFIIVLDWRLALVAIGLLPLFITPTRRVGNQRKQLKRDSQARTAELTGILSETFSVSGALLLKVFGTEETEITRFRRKAEELMTLSIEQSLAGRWFRMLLGLFESFGPAAVFALGGWLVIQGEIELGTVVAFVTLLKRLYTPASQLAGVHVDLMTSYAYFDRIFHVLDLVPEIVDAPDAMNLAKVDGRISFQKVGFCFRETEKILQEIDLEIPSGKTIALVGPSGSGKTTLASLVPRLYEVNEGAVLVDGVDVRSIRMESLRSQIAVVSQETFLFHASVFENLRYGKPDASMEDVKEAARLAQIHAHIETLPEGYETLVGERGVRFSGGERQRLAIARAILKNPRILILDEATSALDSTNEALVQDALAPLRKGRTSLVIAHRLSTIRDADLIVVMEKGRIVERGTHAELLDLNGMFAKLWREQHRAETVRSSAVDGMLLR